MLPIMVIAIGVAVLVFGKRLPVLCAAVGALLGVGLLALFPGQSGPLLELAIPFLLAVIGFFAAGFAKGIVNIVLLVLGALAGRRLCLDSWKLFSINSVLLDLLLAVVGGVIGAMLVMRFEDWAMIILAGLIGGLLVHTRADHLAAVLARRAGYTACYCAGGHWNRVSGWIIWGAQNCQVARYRKTAGTIKRISQLQRVFSLEIS